MKDLEKKQTELVTGAMNLNGLRESMNTINLNGVDKGSWIDAAAGSPSCMGFFRLSHDAP
ncbi:hypothetical protein [Pantoea agglomerans]|uniref:hypothetical protein n=1 Tax=Enterobacter agglomerans TaxID=549 RepID=UPI00129052CA|nr:hypothetical protein [Pantoea agglomerans]